MRFILSAHSSDAPNETKTLASTNNLLCVICRGCSLTLSEDICKGAETESSSVQPFGKDRWAEAADGLCECVCVGGGACVSMHTCECVCLCVCQ